MTCPITGEPLRDGFYIAPSLGSKIREAWDQAAELMPALMSALGKETRHGDELSARTPPGSTPPLNLTLLDPVDEIRDALHAWTWHLTQHISPGLKADIYAWSWASIANYHKTHTAQICRWQEAPTYFEEIPYTIRRIPRMIDPPLNRQYTQCPECKTDNYPKLAAITIDCSNCGTPIHIETRNAQLWETALYHWWPKQQTLKIIHANTGQHLNPATLSKWAQRGKIRTQKTPQKTLYQPHEIIETMRKNRYNKENNKSPAIAVTIQGHDRLTRSR